VSLVFTVCVENKHWTALSVQRRGNLSKKTSQMYSLEELAKVFLKKGVRKE
jgi:hypothetical protein